MSAEKLQAVPVGISSSCTVANGRGRVDAIRWSIKPASNILLVAIRRYNLTSKNMTTHELLYFDGAGRAETIRICLHAGGVNFTDTRFKGADWPTIKPTTPLGSVPVLKVDGVPHCQSVALARYAGKLGGFYPTDPLQALAVDEAIESLNELMAVAPKHSDPEELLKLRKEFQAGVMTKYSDFFEGLIQKNGGVGFASDPSIADLTLWGTVKSIRTGDWTGIDATFFDSYKGITATVDSIAKNEKVVAYYASKE